LKDFNLNLFNSAGKAMSRVIQDLKEIWVEKDFALGEEELLNHIPEILERVTRSPPKSPKSSQKFKSR
jgi:hypothetical protein